MTSTLLIATLPLPPSINEYYSNASFGRAKTEKAKQFWSEIETVLVREIPYSIYTIHYLNKLLLKEIRIAHPHTTSRAKAILAQRRWLTLEVEFYFGSERRDIDGGYKPLQDCLTTWMNNYGTSSFDDKQFVEGRMWKFIVPHCQEHCRVRIQETSFPEQEGMLLQKAMQEVGSEYHADPFWMEQTVAIPAVHISRQKTMKMKAIKKTRKLSHDTTQISYPRGQKPAM